MADLVGSTVDAFASPMAQYSLIFAAVIVLAAVLWVFGSKYPKLKRYFEIASYKNISLIRREARTPPIKMGWKVVKDEDGSVSALLWDQRPFLIDEEFVYDQATAFGTRKYCELDAVGAHEFYAIDLTKRAIRSPTETRVGVLTAKVDSAAYSFVFRNLKKNAEKYRKLKWYQDPIVMGTVGLSIFVVALIILTYVTVSQQAHISDNYLSSIALQYNATLNQGGNAAGNFFSDTAQNLIK